MHILFFCITILALVGVVTMTHNTTNGASSPFVSSITAAATSGGNESTLTLIESTTTPLYVHGSISDADGCADVATNGSVTGKFYRSNHASGDGCSADNNDCYTIENAACTKTACDGPEDPDFNYECTIQVQYYADSTTNGPHTDSDWTAKIIATDASTASGNATDGIEMNNTVALNATSSIDYGTNDLGAESGEQTLTTTNAGNSGIDIDLSVNGPMDCSNGQMAANRVHYSQTQWFAYSGGAALSTTLTELELNLANQTNDAVQSTKNTYFKLVTPSIGVGGSCSNTLTITAKADTENGW